MVIDYSEYKNSRSISGMIAAFQVFFVKVSLGLGGTLVGVFLNMGEYVPHTGQTESVLNYIEISFIWFPLVICVLIGTTIFFYKLNDKHEEMDIELERRRAMNNNNTEPDALNKAH